MQAKSIVTKFVEAIADSRDPRSAINIAISNDPALCLPRADATVEGLDWAETIEPDRRYDFIVVDPPLGMGRTKINIGPKYLSTRGNWAELAKALFLLSPTGCCVAIVEPPAFGFREGPLFQKALEGMGIFLNGVFNAPSNLLTTTSIRPTIVVFSREPRPRLFVAELESESQASAVGRDFAQGITSDSLHEGMLIENGTFDGFESLKARTQIERLETQYKAYKSHALGELAAEINVLSSGALFEHKENSIYVPMLGTSDVTAELSTVTIKHHNIIQVVLNDSVKSQYLAAFFRSDLGLLVLRSLTRGALIPRITKFHLSQAQVAVPSPAEQEEIIRSHDQLQKLTRAIGKLQSELALNPGSASAVRLQAEKMLETVGALTEADRIMNMAREGESGTVEFKQSFSLDVRKGTKADYIELQCLKTIVAFLNTNGGVLIVGVTDRGEISGVEGEVKKFYKSNDAFLLHFKNRLKQRIGEQTYPFISHRLVAVGTSHVLIVECIPAASPCYLDGKDFYVRTNPSTDKLEGPKLVEYVQNHFNKVGRL